MRLLAFARPLPLSIAAMLLLAVVKLGGLVHGLVPSFLSPSGAMLPSASAAEKPAHGAPVSSAPASALPGVPTAGAPSAALPGGVTPVATPPSAVEVVPVEPGPSEAERALLMDLRQRRITLEERAQALEAREGLLKAAERSLSDRVDQLATMQTRLEALEKARRERDEANWRGLVKTYETMRPRDAAAIFSDLDQTVLMQVLDRMKEAKAAPILAAMPPERARAATTQLAQWRARATAPAGGDRG